MINVTNISEAIAYLSLILCKHVSMEGELQKSFTRKKSSWILGTYDEG